MGLFGNLVGKTVGNAINEGIGKGIRDAVGKATEDLVAPKAEEYANKIAKSLDRASQVTEAYADEVEQVITSQEAISVADSEDIPGFPAWRFSPITDIHTDDEDDYTSISISAELTDDDIEQYQALLKADGFEGDWQIMRKIIGGKEHIADFSFVPDGEIRYLIYK